MAGIPRTRFAGYSPSIAIDFTYVGRVIGRRYIYCLEAPRFKIIPLSLGLHQDDD